MHLTGKQDNSADAPCDLTPLWDRAHSHLRPLPGYIPLSDDQYVACPQCGDGNAVGVLANLRFGEQGWVANAEVVYCGSCDRFSIPHSEGVAYAQQATADGLDCGATLTALDARLWSREPKVLNIEPTTRCNFACWYCVGRSMSQVDLSAADFERVLDNFPTLEVVAIVGEGEPILNKQFFRMVQLAKARGLRVLSLSNGSTFSASVVQKICEAGIDYIGISIDSTRPEVFAESRCKGDLNRVWEGIERLVRYRDRNGYRYPILGLKGTLFRHTEHELPDIVRAAKEHGIDVLESFQALNPKASYVQTYPANKKDWIADYQRIEDRIQSDTAAVAGILPSAWEFAANENLKLSNMGRPNPLRANCDEEWIYSLAKGDITPCCQIKDPLDPAWNLTRHSIKEILQDQHYEQTRFNLWNGLFPKCCEGCHKTRRSTKNSSGRQPQDHAYRHPENDLGSSGLRR